MDILNFIKSNNIKYFDNIMIFIVIFFYYFIETI